MKLRGWDLLTKGQEIFRACNKICFNNKLLLVSIGDGKEQWNPETEKGVLGMFVGRHIIPGHNSPKSIYVNLDWLGSRSDEDYINLMFHEMCHQYCCQNNIEDGDYMKGYSYHNEAYRDVVEAHGGIGRFEGFKTGYSGADLRPAAMKRVTHQLRANLSELRLIRGSEVFFNGIGRRMEGGQQWSKVP